MTKECKKKKCYHKSKDCFAFFPDQIRGLPGPPGPQGNQGVAGPIIDLWELTDAEDSLETAEDGTTLVRVSDEWVKNSYNRIAIGYGTVLATDSNNTIVLGFNEAGESHINGIHSANCIAIGSNASRYSSGTAPRLSIAIDAVITTINIEDTSNLSPGQDIKIDTEIITVGTISGLDLIGCTRGVAPSIADSHAFGTRVLILHPDADHPVDLEYRSSIIPDRNSGTIAIGAHSGEFEQATNSIAIGFQAGEAYQETFSIAIGFQAAYNTQKEHSVAIGYRTGESAQGASCVAIGFDAGRFTQGDYSVAIGHSSGNSSQGFASIAIGREAGYAGQEDYSIAIGHQAGLAATHDSSIIINAGSSSLNSLAANKCYINPVANVGVGGGGIIGPPAGTEVVCYNTTTSELGYYTQV